MKYLSKKYHFEIYTIYGAQKEIENSFQMEFILGVSGKLVGNDKPDLQKIGFSN